MKKIFVLNGAPEYAHSEGRFNRTLSGWTLKFLHRKNFETKYTDINQDYDLEEEVEKFVWSDIVVYHTSIWWFQLPHLFKKYIDDVFTEGSNNRIYHSDGQQILHSSRNYGSGGSLQGRKYMLTTTWNAPLESFTLKDEFLDQRGVDESIMFGFHRMNAFIGMAPLESFHFYNVMENPNIEQAERKYLVHLKEIICLL